MLLTRVSQRGNLFNKSSSVVSTNKNENNEDAAEKDDESNNHHDNEPPTTSHQNHDTTEDTASIITQTVQQDEAINHQHHHSHGKECRCYTHPPVDNSLVQTLDEVAFDNGIWALISRGASTQKVKEFLTKSASKIGLNNNNVEDNTLSHSTDEVDQRMTTTSWRFWCTKKCPSGYSPLLYAARAGNLETVILLVQNGADAKNEVTPATGQSALHRAAAVGNIEICEYLLERCGSELKTIRDSRGLTAYDWVEQNLYRTNDLASEEKRGKVRNAMLKLLAP